MKTLRAILELPVVVGLCLLGAVAAVSGAQRLEDWCLEELSYTQFGTFK